MSGWVRSMVLFAGLAGCGTPGCGAAPGNVEREGIEATLYASDTVVTYRDGRTAIGAVFGEEHRYALHFEDLPLAWVLAIIAAEDGRFWKHGGFDPGGIARAARDNLGAGGVVSGGSTLTQQLAKNLFERPGRSLAAKWEELDYAMHLEELFSKTEILAFYANLFHVTGNGAGLGIAARYYFDKTPSELSVLECAYIAGLVKGPANYDPFIGDAERQAKATQRANDRTRYVLERLVTEDLGAIMPPGMGAERSAQQIKAEAQRLLDGGFEVPFQRGEFRHASNTVVDEVKRRLETPFFQDVLAEAGVSDPATAGLTVVTTIDQGMQHEAVYGLWHHLTELGIMLEGLGSDAFVHDASLAPRHDRYDLPVRHAFRYATVTGHGENNELSLDLGGFGCTVDRDALVRAAVAVHRGEKGDRWAKAPTAVIDGFAESIPDGAVVWVSIRDDEPGAERCDLELRPEVQGAVVAVEQGQVRARVGGTTNRDFDRTQALRQFGSTFKPLVYHAAMTLGWRPDDVLVNSRTTFEFSGSTYAPRPDHTPEPEVTMAWAGVKSENIASVWLLYHLVDQLSPAELSEVADTVGLGRIEGESDREYRTRMQKAGVMVTKRDLEGIHFAAAKSQQSAQLKARGAIEEARALRAAGDGRTFQSLVGSLDRCREAYKSLKKAARKDQESTHRALYARKVGEEIELSCGYQPDGFEPAGPLLTPPQPDERASRPPQDDIVDRVAAAFGGRGRKSKSRRSQGKAKTKTPSQPIPEAVKARDLPPIDDMWMSESLTFGTVDELASSLQRQRLAVETATTDLYDPEILHWHPDFRVLVALRYVTQLAEAYGVQTELKQVLSLPLGASEITLEEATVLYGGLTSGSAWVAPDSELGPTVLIGEIRDSRGAVVYQAEVTRTNVVDPVVGDMTADILRNVVLHGTGRRAKGAVEVGGSAVPLGGKTGTTNDFRNAAFLGYMPKGTPRGYSAADGHAVGVYVGYDDNREMKAGNLKVSGATGALPPWISTVQGIDRWSEDGGSGVAAGSEGWPLAFGAGLERVVVADGGSVLTLQEVDPGLVGSTSEVAAATRERKAKTGRKGTRKPTDRRRRPWWQVW